MAGIVHLELTDEGVDHMIDAIFVKASALVSHKTVATQNLLVVGSEDFYRDCLGLHGFSSSSNRAQRQSVIFLLCRPDLQRSSIGILAGIPPRSLSVCLTLGLVTARVKGAELRYFIWPLSPSTRSCGHCRQSYRSNTREPVRPLPRCSR